MIRDYVSNIAVKMGITLSAITIVEGRTVGCLDADLLRLTSNDQIISILVYHSELATLHSDRSCERLEMRIRSAVMNCLDQSFA